MDHAARHTHIHTRAHVNQAKEWFKKKKNWSSQVLTYRNKNAVERKQGLINHYQKCFVSVLGVIAVTDGTIDAIDIKDKRCFTVKTCFFVLYV